MVWPYFSIEKQTLKTPLECVLESHNNAQTYWYFLVEALVPLLGSLLLTRQHCHVYGWDRQQQRHPYMSRSNWQWTRTNDDDDAAAAAAARAVVAAADDIINKMGSCTAVAIVVYIQPPQAKITIAECADDDDGDNDGNKNWQMMVMVSMSDSLKQSGGGRKLRENSSSDFQETVTRQSGARWVAVPAQRLRNKWKKLMDDLRLVAHTNIYLC